MKIEEMKAIADKRSKGGKWFWDSLTSQFEDLYSTDGVLILASRHDGDLPGALRSKPEDRDFIAMAANHWDNIMDVIENAKTVIEFAHQLNEPFSQLQNLIDAIEKLEKN